MFSQNQLVKMNKGAIQGTNQPMPFDQSDHGYLLQALNNESATIPDELIKQIKQLRCPHLNELLKMRLTR